MLNFISINITAVCTSCFVILNCYSGAWASKTKDTEQWIQAQFSSHFMVTAIQTRGRSMKTCYEWVKSYQISHSNDGNKWVYVTKDGDGMVRSL